MPNLEERMARLEAKPEFKALPPDRQAALRRAAFEKVREEYAASSRAAMAQQEQQFGMLGTAANAVGSFGSGMLNTMTLGYAPQMAAAIGLPAVAGGVQDSAQAAGMMDAAQQISPVANAAGQLAGNFIGPAAGAARGLSNLGVRGGAAIAGRVGATAAVNTLESEFARRAIEFSAKNLIGGATAVGGLTALQSRDDGAGLGQRLSDAASASLSPTTLALSIGGGLLQAKLARPPSAELASAVSRYERITGKKVPIETLTDATEQQKFYDFVARVPGMGDTLQRQRKSAVDGLRQVVDSIRRGARAAPGTTEQLRGAAAKTVRGVVEGLPAQRRSLTQSAMAQVGKRTPALPDSNRILGAGMKAMRQTRPAAEASELEAVFSKIDKLTQNRTTPLTLGDMEAIRKEVSRLSSFMPGPHGMHAPGAGDRGRWEASRFYKVLTTAMERSFPEYREALRSGKALRDMERTLADVQVSQIDDAMAQSFFSGKNVLDRITTLEKNATKQDLESLRGWYFAKFMGRVANEDGNINPRTLERVLGASGPFNSQVFNRMLPGALPEIRDHARLTAAMLGRGRFGAEGSQTAGRAMRGVGALATASAGPAAAITAQLSNPFNAIVAILAPVGAKVALRSAMGGMIEGHLQNLSRLGPRPLGPGAMAANQITQGITGGQQ